MTATTDPVLGQRGAERRVERAAGASHDLTFGDLLDIINPLQHIPIVGTIYRAMVGDEISGVARVMGNLLYGGPLGLMTGIVSASIADSSGSDVGERILAWAGANDVAEPAADPALVQVASAPAVLENDAALAALAADLGAGATVTVAPVPPTPPIEIRPIASQAASASYQNILESVKAGLDRYDALKAEPGAPPSY
ncbi:MAG: hypothetical protein EXQ94_04790 [Alphaproteobacteria bacterium]|nr:hypothetical protein [Alphaproteobacteria bacterium]